MPLVEHADFDWKPLPSICSGCLQGRAADTLPNRLLAGIMQQCMPSGSQAQQAADTFTCYDVGQGPDVQRQVQVALQLTPRAGARPRSAPPASLARRAATAGAAAGEGVESPGNPCCMQLAAAWCGASPCDSPVFDHCQAPHTPFDTGKVCCR